MAERLLGKLRAMDWTKAVWIWAFLTISSELHRRTHLKLPWLMLAPLVLIGPSFLRWHSFRFDLRQLWPPLMIVVSVLITALVSGNFWYDAAQAIKIATILIVGMPLFKSHPRYARAAFSAIVTLACVNALLLALGRWVSPVFAVGNPRWTTLLTRYGVLHFAGSAIFVYSLYGLRSKEHRWTSFLTLCASVAVVHADGSRTAALFLLLGLAYVISLVLWESGKDARLTIVGAIGAITAALIGFDWLLGRQIQGAVARFGRFLYNLKEYGFLEGLAKSDPVRFDMMKVALEAVSGGAFIGTGMGTTKALTRVGEMVVHNAYLQIWADAGILAAAGFTVVCWGWILWLPRALRSIRSLSDAKERALYYNAVFMLFSFGLYQHLHALSTEWTEWLYFLAPYALFWEVVALKERVTLGAAADGIDGGDHDVQPLPARGQGDRIRAGSAVAET